MSLTSNTSVSRIRIIGSGVEGRTDNHFAQPRGICVDQFAKELYVVDCNNHRVCVFSLVSLTFLRQIGRGIQGSGPGCLNYAVGACLDFENHHIYVADTNNHRISVFDQVTGAFIRCIGFYGMGRGELNSPYGVCIDSTTGSLFVTDYDNHRVQVFDIATRKFLRTIGSGLGSGPGQMNQPIVPYLDEETGFLYVADYSNNRVQIFDKDTGTYIRQIGGGGVGGSMTGLGADALNGPRGICVDGPSGLLFIADRENHRIRIYDKTTFVFLRFLGNGQGASPGQFHRPMEICVSSEDSSIYVVDGYNHRVQVILLPELQAISSKSGAAVSIPKEERIENFGIIRPSRISVQTDISLLRLPRSHLRMEESLITAPSASPTRVKLLFPLIGSYVTIPITDIEHLVRNGFFVENTEEDMPSSRRTSSLGSFDDTADRTGRCSEHIIDDNLHSRNALKLNHQAAVFMGLITGVVSDSRESNVKDPSSRCGRYDVSSSVTKSDTALGINQESMMDEADGNHDGNFVIDYSLIVPSVFALNALLLRSWLPSVHMPPSVINSLVHMMCHKDVAVTCTSSSSECRRVVKAAAALLMAIVCAGTEASASVFSHIIDELRNLAEKVSKTRFLDANTRTDDLLLPREISEIQISVSPHGADRSILSEGGLDPYNIGGIQSHSDLDDSEEGLDALKLLAFILSSQSESPCPYPSSLPLPSISMLPVVGANAFFHASDTTWKTAGSPCVNLSSNYDIDIRMLVFGHAWTEEHRNSQKDGFISKASAGVKRHLSPSEVVPNSYAFSQSTSPSHLHSFPLFPICPSSSSPHAKESSSHPDITQESSSSSPLSTEFLDFVDIVSKINKARQCADTQNFSRDQEEAIIQMQFDLFKKANSCFSQIPLYWEVPKKLRKATQGGRHIWQQGQPLAVGDLVDARDREKSWFESYVTEVRPSAPSSSTSRAGISRERMDVKVHYMGWGSKWDDWVSEWDLEARIAPLNSRSKNWRADLFEGGLIEIKCNDDMVNQKWMWGKIIALNYSEGWVDVSYTFTNEPTVVKRADLFGETLCMVGMHTKDKSKLAAASIIRPERKIEELLRSKMSSKNSPAPMEDFTFCDFDDSLGVDDTDVEASRGQLEDFEIEGIIGGQSRCEILTNRKALQLYPTVTMPLGLLSKIDIDSLSAVGAADCISSVTFHCVMREVLEIVCEHLFCEELLDDSDLGKKGSLSSVEKPCVREDLLGAAISLLRTIAASSSRRVLVPYFCRAVTVQCGLRSKLISQNELLLNPSLLRVDVSVTPLAALLNRLDRLGDSYCSLLIKCFDSSQDAHRMDGSTRDGATAHSLPIDQLQYAARRIKATVSKCAIAPLARKIFHNLTPVSSDLVQGPVSCLSRALTVNLLEGLRFNGASTAVRRLLSTLILSSSEKDLDHLEHLWTKAITAWVVGVVKKCSDSTCHVPGSPGTGVSFLDDDVDSEADEGTTLNSYDHEMKSISPGTHSRKHTISSSSGISKAHMISRELGRSRSDSDFWCAGSEDSFEDLLPRLIIMLNKARSISKLEFNATRRCTRSADVAFREAFEQISEESRCYLMKVMAHSIDNRLAFESAPHSTNNAEAPTLSPKASKIEDLLDFAQIVLKESNSKSFEDHYQLLLARRLIRISYVEGLCSSRREGSPLSDRAVLLALPPLSLASAMISDIEQTPDRMSDFRHHLLFRIDNDELDYSPSPALNLAIKPGALNVHILSASSWPKGAVSPLSYASLKLPKCLSIIADEFDNFFQSSGSSNQKHTSHTNYADTFSCRVENVRTVGGAKRLHWCHGYSTVTLSCRIHQTRAARHSSPPSCTTGGSSSSSSTVKIILSTPQAAVLMAFQSSVPLTAGTSDSSKQNKVELSRLDLSRHTNLWDGDMSCIIASLCDAALPLLQIRVDKHSKEIYSLSDHLLSGSLRGSRDGDALVAVGGTLDPSFQHSKGVEVKLSRSWRENLIDACIIRTLKGVGNNKSGVFQDYRGRILTCTLSFAELCSAVKLVLETRKLLVLLPSDEIRIRCNKLVEQGIIECYKGLAGSVNALLSVGYSYLPDIPDVSSYSVPDHTPAIGSSLFKLLCDALIPETLEERNLRDVRISSDKFCNAFATWISKSTLESRSSPHGVSVIHPTQRRTPAPQGIAALGGMQAISIARFKELTQKARMEDGSDRSGEHKENYPVHFARTRAGSGEFLPDMAPLTFKTACNESLRIIQKKLLLAYSASIEQLCRLKHQHLLTFGLDECTGIPCSSTNKNPLLSNMHLRNLQDSENFGDLKDMFEINQTVLCSLPLRTIQLVLHSFNIMQDHSNFTVEFDEKMSRDTDKSIGCGLDITGTYTESGPDSRSDRDAEIFLESRNLQDSFSRFFGSVEGKSPDASVNTFSVRNDENIFDKVFGDEMKSPELCGSLASRESVSELIRSMWDKPVPVSEDRVRSALATLSSQSPVQDIFTHRADIAYRSSRLQRKDELSMTFLRGILTYFPTGDVCNELDSITVGLPFEDFLSTDYDNSSSIDEKPSPEYHTFSGTCSDINQRADPKGSLGPDSIPHAVKIQSPPLLKMTLCEFISAALSAACMSGADSRTDIGHHAPSSSPYRPDGRFDPLDKRTPSSEGPGTTHSRDLRSRKGGGHSSENLDRYERGSHTPAQRLNQRDNRVREKSPRSGNGNRERKVRMRVLKGSPYVFPPPSPTPPSGPFLGDTFDRFLNAQRGGIVSPRHADRSVSRSSGSSDGVGVGVGVDDDQLTSRFLFGSSFQSPRSFADFSGTHAAGTLLPRGDSDQGPAAQIPAAFAPYNHPSFDRSISTSASYSASEPSRGEVGTLSSSSFTFTAASVAVPSVLASDFQTLHPTVPSLRYPSPTNDFSTLPTPAEIPLKSQEKQADSKFFYGQALRNAASPEGNTRASRPTSQSPGRRLRAESPSVTTEGSLHNAVGIYMRRMDICLRGVLSFFEAPNSDDAKCASSSTGTEKRFPVLDEKGEDVEKNSTLNKIIWTLLSNVAVSVKTKSITPDTSDPNSPHKNQIDLKASSCPYLGMMQQCFEDLDVDMDGFLTLKDFSEEQDAPAVVRQVGEGDKDGEEEDGREEKSEDKVQVLESRLGPWIEPLTQRNLGPSNASALTSDTDSQGGSGDDRNKDLSRSIEMLVRLVRFTLQCDESLSDQILHLLVDYKWDVDVLILELTSPSRDGGRFRGASLSSQSFRRMSSVIRRLGRKGAVDAAATGAVGSTDGIAVCACGAASHSDSYSIKECRHWHCRDCWLKVISSSLNAKATSTNDPYCSDCPPSAGLGPNRTVQWRCPSVGPLGQGRCEARIRGDLISHLSDGDASVRQVYYLSQVRACVDSLSCKVIEQMSRPSCSSVPSTAMMQWWAAASRKESSGGSSAMSPSGLSRPSFIVNIDDSRMREKEILEGESSDKAGVYSSTALAAEAYRRLIDASCSAETRRIESSLGAECAVDNPNAVRLHTLSDRWALLATAASLLAHTHIILAAETDGGDILQQGPDGIAISGKGDTEQGWTDIRSLSQHLDAMERLTVSFGDTLFKLAIVWGRDPLQTGPQTQALIALTRTMAGTLRQLQWNLAEKITYTHSFRNVSANFENFTVTYSDPGFGIPPLF